MLTDATYLPFQNLIYKVREVTSTNYELHEDSGGKC